MEEALEALKAKGQVFEEDGAVWLSTVPYGDDKTACSSKTTVPIRI
ncbi:hypothetical protein PACILC2_41900 [Paenibacillus cisolokensis]|uniref:Uncharacterized protein n=1 Tax=Paenibacillus cisolokensis TaxID=1658519 RepID=A0ABQ4NBP1_9BACL|nr:hypothetical protein PACILC2_41900 [Paenibacillus cisolokensis]